ncbi:MAG: uracil-DNA glycosylase [Bacteroidetes bacterium HGW-Bacteroidetes-21]|jgi:DNA polymerase|nr:MAG: uracil-DNA glycosylase [Bacteroidetes bacterium HGW-Bacteroidetes-21]
MNQEYEQLKKTVLACTKCRLSETRTQVVFGEGNPQGGILIIGEGPGRDEDLQGRPFVGRSGKLLDKILADCGFNRTNHVFIANIVKCRPPENRVPLPDEKAACIPFLMKQIELLDPKIILLLGATALNGLVDPKLKITKVRGQWMEWNNRLVMPVFHPSALLRNPNLKPETMEDFKKVVAKYREVIDPKHISENC